MAASTIEVAFGVDAAYLPHLAAAASSIDGTCRSRDVVVHVLHDAVSDADRLRFDRSLPGLTVHWRKVDDGLIRHLPGISRFSKAMYYRLALPDILPESPKVLYLDCDLLVLRDLQDLWATPLTRPVGAVVDGWTDPIAFRDRWGLSASGRPSYFNSGVMLIDLAAAKGSPGLDDAFAFVEANHRALTFSDQDALNVAFWGRWQELDVLWNVQRNMLIDEPWKPGVNAASPVGRLPAIVHYTTEHKPWLPGTYHPYAWLYWRALRRTPFHGDVASRHGVGFRERARLLARWLRARSRLEAN